MKSQLRFVSFLSLLRSFCEVAIAQGVQCPDVRITRTLFGPSDATTKQKQVPWDHSSLMGDVVLARSGG
jgi:hypothetical protein